MFPIMQKKYVFWLSLSFLSIILGIQIYLAIKQNGMFSYPLDDSYIHMAIAKNIAKHGVWGITKYGFTSASSSILYSLILSFFFLIFGVNIWIPLIINWIAAVGILYFIVKWASHYLSAWSVLVFSIIFILLTPLPVIVIMGMEHTLHILFSLIFLYITFRKIEGDEIPNGLYFIIAVLVVSIRYEGVFLVGITAFVWAFLQKRPALFAVLIAGIIIPIAFFGIYSVSHGGFFLPNSLLIKGPDASHSISQFIGSIMKRIYNTGLIYALLFIPCIYFFLVPMDKSKPLRKYPVHLLFIIISCTCLAHFLLARLGKPYRYGAYLIAMELMFIPVVWKQVFTYIKRLPLFSAIAISFLAVFSLLPVLFRSGATMNNNISMKNIRDQQVAMALFLHEYFPQTTVALNDIGAVAFYNDDIHIFDLVGLANIDILKYHKKSDTTFLKRYTEKDHVKMALVYPDWIEWLGYKMPDNWELLGKWYLTNNYIAGNPDLGIFALDPSVKDTLMNALKAYSPHLPLGVIQSGQYLK